jgi:hypothetical protein
MKHLQIQSSDLEKGRLGRYTEMTVPTKTLQRWEQIEPSKFNAQRAKECFCIATGAWKNIEVSTPTAAILADTPTIGGMAHYLGKDTAIMVLTEIITANILLLNAGKNIEAFQIEPIAEILFDEHKTMTIADWKTCMRMGVTGKLGKIFDRLDIEILSNWAKDYFELRLLAGEAITQARQNNNKVDYSNAVPLPPEMQEWFLKLTEKLTVNKFEPDAAILKYWESEWNKIPDDTNKPKLETYIQFQTIKMQRK